MSLLFQGNYLKFTKKHKQAKLEFTDQDKLKKTENPRSKETRKTGSLDAKLTIHREKKTRKSESRKPNAQNCKPHMKINTVSQSEAKTDVKT